MSPRQRRVAAPAPVSRSSRLPDFVGVARVRAPHGVRGELRVEPLTDDPGRLASLGPCRLRLPGGELRAARVVEVRPGPRASVLVRLEGVEDRTAAEALRGAYLEVPAGSAPPLPEGRYYVFQIVGCQVVDEGGALLGHIEEVLQTPAHDVWVVRRDRGRLLLPAIRQVVQEVDVEAGRVVVRVPPGLEEG